MKLTHDQICQAVSGISYAEFRDGRTVFHRFSEELEEMYRREVPGFNEKLLATAGVAMRFSTDSSSLTLNVETGRGSTRTYFAHDVYADGKYIDSLRNFGDDDLKGTDPKVEFPLGCFEKRFELGSGNKEITIHFPALASSFINFIEMDDGASFTPKRRDKIYLALGDSISQGYDCKYPGSRYTAKVADCLGLSEHNLSIGGDVFRPEAAELVKEENVSLITVAYGSNDWNGIERSRAEKNCEEYFRFLAGNMPGIPVCVISPIWRLDCDRVTDYGEFADVEMILRRICDTYENFTFVRGFDFVPHDTTLFGDGMLHPNDEGFAYYAGSLIKEIQKH